MQINEGRRSHWGRTLRFAPAGATAHLEESRILLPAGGVWARNGVR
jgi:hypothetical protein